MRWRRCYPSRCKQFTLLLNQLLHIGHLLDICDDFSVQVGQLLLLTVFFGGELDVNFLFQSHDPGDKTTPTRWILEAADADTDKNQDENHRKEVASVFDMKLALGCDKNSLE